MSATGYRWTCPICGKSRVQLRPASRSIESVTNDLLSHIRGVEGDGHGPNGSSPETVDEDALAAHVFDHTPSTVKQSP